MAQQLTTRSSGKIEVADLNALLACVLCNGYIIDATTISECLHSFCRTCIVRYLQTNKFCPICEVQVHKTRPLMGIRADQTLQDIVYKIVPGLFKNEMKRRRDFYAKLNESGNGAYIPVSGEKRGDVLGCERLIFTPDDVISISLEYCPSNLAFPLKFEVDDGVSMQQHKRYLQCPGGLRVLHLKKFLRAKYGLLPDQKVDIMYMHDQLLDEYTLVDLAYSYSWRRNGPMRLFYKIPEMKSEAKELDTVSRAIYLMPVSSCSDMSSSPSLGAAPTSHSHFQCHPSPPSSPQTAMEPGDMKIENPYSASMSNNSSAVVENNLFEKIMNTSSRFLKNDSVAKSYNILSNSHQPVKSANFSKRKSSGILDRSTKCIVVEKSWAKSGKNESINRYSDIEGTGCKPCKNDSFLTNDLNRSEKCQSSLFSEKINLISNIPNGKMKQSRITVRNSL